VALQSLLGTMTMLCVTVSTHLLTT